jgi:hypothetical protein
MIPAYSSRRSFFYLNTEDGRFEDVTQLPVKVVPLEGINTSSTGCAVTVEQRDVIRMRQVEGGIGTTGQNSGILHFGLSSGTSAVMRLYLPGEVEPFETVTAVPGTVIEAGSRQQMY